MSYPKKPGFPEKTTGLGRGPKSRNFHVDQFPQMTCQKTRKNMLIKNKIVKKSYKIYFATSDPIYRFRNFYRIFPDPISGKFHRIRIQHIEKPQTTKYGVYSAFLQPPIAKPARL